MTEQQAALLQRLLPDMADEIGRHFVLEKERQRIEDTRQPDAIDAIPTSDAEAAELGETILRAEIEASRRRVAARKKSAQHVYFIRSIRGGPIKIGIARDVVKRKNDMSTGSPYPLGVVGLIWNGGPKEEKRLHKRFERKRIHREWFDIGDDEMLQLWREDRLAFFPLLAATSSQS